MIFNFLKIVLVRVSCFRGHFVIIRLTFPRRRKKNEINEKHGESFPSAIFSPSAPLCKTVHREPRTQKQSFVFGEKKKNVRQDREITFPR